MSTRWPEATSPDAAYLDVLYKRDPELISADNRIDLFNKILYDDPSLHRQQEQLARLYRLEGQNTNALREYK